MAGNKRRNGKKKKKSAAAAAAIVANSTSESGNAVAPMAPPDPPKPPPPIQEENDGGPVKRTYWKIKAFFKCSGEACGKTWTSVHAWEREETLYCDFCGAIADAKQFKDEMLELDNYYCGCGERWQSIHSEEGTEGEECDCGTHVMPEGTQSRFGRHFWFECTNKSCGIVFEDFSLTAQRTQYCSSRRNGIPCGQRGDIIKTIKVLPKPRGDGDAGGMGGGSHNYENCDMCRDLKAQGKRGSCLKLKKVHCQVPDGSDVPSNERITGVEEIKPSQRRLPLCDFINI